MERKVGFNYSPIFSSNKPISDTSKTKIFEILISAAIYGALLDFTLRYRFWWTITQQAAGKCPL